MTFQHNAGYLFYRPESLDALQTYPQFLLITYITITHLIQFFASLSLKHFCY